MSLGGTLLNCYLSNFRLALVAVLACVTIGSSAVQLQATVIPPISLAPGSQYQLIFVTAGTRDATSGHIADYNAFVSAEAALSPSLPTTNWRAVASTAARNEDGTFDEITNAVNNAPWHGLPVYNTQGVLVRSADYSIYPDGLPDFTYQLLSPVGFDQFGLPITPNTLAGLNGRFTFPYTEITLVWTGAFNWPLGYGQYPAWGVAELSPFPNDRSTSGWYWYCVDSVVSQSYLDSPVYVPITNRYPLYALSDPITVPVPEPSTMTLLGLAITIMVGVRRRLAASV